ncbi:hypothetical protein HBB16_00985 [Pseudonocardia sp. MCCB 268]|nr:hypothetical protein [Pseudonocardia cytotoxica]
MMMVIASVGKIAPRRRSCGSCRPASRGGCSSATSCHRHALGGAGVSGVFFAETSRPPSGTPGCPSATVGMITGSAVALMIAAALRVARRPAGRRRLHGRHRGADLAAPRPGSDRASHRDWCPSHPPPPDHRRHR